MKITKSNWTTDGDTFTVAMPMSKVDKQNRLVSGWASLDNPDLQGDVVTAEASEKAFRRFRGNIREMHQPIAVGRMVSYRPDSYYDETAKKFYNGIFVTAYVSKGAQDTWEKVLDGTLQAFSIKGPIIDSEMEFSKDAGRPLRIVKDYDLEELSLVDSGGNQYANVVSVMKVNGETQVSGMVTETKSENVFYCDKHESPVAKTSTEDSAECLEGHNMQNIGWIEYDDTNRADKVAEVIEKYNTSQNAEQEVPATNEGGVDVADTVEKEVVATDAAPADEAKGGTVEVVNNDESVVTEEVAPVEAANVPESEVDKPDFAKMFGDLQAAIESRLEKNNVAAQESLTKVTEVFEGKFEELAKSYTELTTKFDSIQTELKSVEKSLAAVEAETAVKKSGDLGGSTEDTLVKSHDRKSISWSGVFLGTKDDE